MGAIIITGAAKRGGRAIAERFADLKKPLILHANSSKAKLEAFAAELREKKKAQATTVYADLSMPQSVDQMVQDCLAVTADVELIVHNAAVYAPQAFDQTPMANVRQTLEINLMAPYALTQGLLPALRAGEGGQVIFVGDAGARRPYPKHVPYMLSKLGIHQLTELLALELAPTIRVNCIAPGWLAYNADQDADAQAKVRSAIPMGRLGTFDDLAQAVFQVATQMPYMNGQVVCLDGGLSVASGSPL